MTSPQFREVRRTIYALKRAHGQRLQLVQVTNVSTNYQTGKKSEAHAIQVVKRAVLLPSQEHRKFSYDLSFIAANRNFTYGGFYDIDLVTVLVDQRDLTADVDLNMHAYFNSKRYEVKKIIRYQEFEAVVLVLQTLAGAPQRQQLSASASASAQASASATGAL